MKKKSSPYIYTRDMDVVIWFVFMVVLFVIGKNFSHYSFFILGFGGNHNNDDDKTYETW